MKSRKGRSKGGELMSNSFKAILSVLMIGMLAVILGHNNLEDTIKLVVFYLGIKEIPKLFL